MVYCVSFVSAIFVTTRTEGEVGTAISAALRQESLRPLAVEEICTIINDYQPWRIEKCRGKNKRLSAEVKGTSALLSVLHYNSRQYPSEIYAGYYRNLLHLSMTALLAGT